MNQQHPSHQLATCFGLLSGLRQRDNDRVFPRQRSVPVWPTSRLLPVDGSRRWFAVGSPLPFCFQEMHQYTIYASSPPPFVYQVTVNHHRGCFVRVPDRYKLLRAGFSAWNQSHGDESHVCESCRPTQTEGQPKPKAPPLGKGGWV